MPVHFMSQGLNAVLSTVYYTCLCICILKYKVKCISHCMSQYKKKKKRKESESHCTRLVQSYYIHSLVMLYYLRGYHCPLLELLISHKEAQA